MSERTPQEREAARREREARRSGRRFDAPEPSGPTEPGPTEPAAPPVPPRSEPAARDSAPAPAPPPPSFEPPHEAAIEPTDEFFHDGENGRSHPEREVPLGVRRVGGLRDGAGMRRAKGQRSVRPPKGRSHALRGGSIVPRVFAIAALVLALGLIWFLVELFQPFQGSGHGLVVFTVRSGVSAGTVGDELAKDGVVSSGFFFDLRAMLAGDRGKLLAGTYRLRRDMGYGAVLSILTTPPARAPTTNVTVIPGRTRRQVATLLHEQHVHGHYLGDTRHTTLLNLRAYGAPRNLNTLEGFLFPSTYQLREPINMPALVADQLTTFRQQFATVNMAYARSKHLTPYDVLIIASMVEAEAGTPHDRPLIASVIYNRLRLGMPLGIDATVRYAVNNYTSPLTDSQLASPSPYNTRNHTGLPPTPIDSPGLAAIQAAAHPRRTTYLYFVAKPCGNGASAFATTPAQAQVNAQRYNQARARRGGRSPEKC
jgi:UPF0755 protein